MAITITRKNLGQSAPLATTLTTLYTVPAATSTVVSTITVANRSEAATTFRLSHAVAGAANADAQYFVYDAAISGNQRRRHGARLDSWSPRSLREHATVQAAACGTMESSS